MEIWYKGSLGDEDV